MRPLGQASLILVLFASSLGIYCVGISTVTIFFFSLGLILFYV